MCMERGLGGVFGEAEIKLLLKTQTATFQGLGADRVGKFTAGASAAAALWWLLCQPKAALRQPPTVSHTWRCSSLQACLKGMYIISLFKPHCRNGALQLSGHPMHGMFCFYNARANPALPPPTYRPLAPSPGLQPLGLT
jgi:hypothetical protein